MSEVLVWVIGKGTVPIPPIPGWVSSISFVTQKLESSLPSSRVLTAGSNVTLSDGGPSGDLTVSASGGGGGDAGAVDWTTSKNIAASASPYSIQTTDSLFVVSAGASADTILLLPAATGSKKSYVVMRAADGFAHHAIIRPHGSDTIFPNPSGSGSSDYWADIEGESVWFHDFASGQYLSL